jgi:hypothetical protein
MRGAGATGNRKDGRLEPHAMAGRPTILCPYAVSPETTRNFVREGGLSQTWPQLTLLGNSKPRGRAVLPPPVEGRRDGGPSPGETDASGLALGHRDAPTAPVLARFASASGMRLTRQARPPPPALGLPLAPVIPRAEPPPPRGR